MSETIKYNTGELFKETIRMAWPALLESFFVALAGMIDTMMVSTMGTYAVAAVGLTTQPKFITLAVFTAQRDVFVTVLFILLAAFCCRGLEEKGGKPC